MALVPAKCTQCGGNIEVDDTHEAGICQHCGTPFITEKAINNYTTNVTNNIVNNNNFNGANVVINENDNLEKMIERAETFEKLEEFRKANNVYAEIVETYPMDCRGWLGLIKTDTKNFTNIGTFFTYDKIIEIFEKAIKVANFEMRDYILEQKKNYENLYKQEIAKRENGRYNAKICNLYDYRDVEKALGCKCLTSKEYSFESFTFVLGNYVECSVSYMGFDYTGTECKVKRQHTFSKSTCEKNVDRTNIEQLLSEYKKKSERSGGCYIATCVYGSYDCPQVWTLRRYRDYTLDETWYGRLFIKCYYAVSPKLVKLFGNYAWFRKPWKKFLDGMVERLNYEGVADTKYSDKY